MQITHMVSGIFRTSSSAFSITLTLSTLAGSDSPPQLPSEGAAPVPSPSPVSQLAVGATSPDKRTTPDHRLPPASLSQSGLWDCGSAHNFSDDKECFDAGVDYTRSRHAGPAETDFLHSHFERVKYGFWNLRPRRWMRRSGL